MQPLGRVGEQIAMLMDCAGGWHVAPDKFSTLRYRNWVFPYKLLVLLFNVQIDYLVVAKNYNFIQRLTTESCAVNPKAKMVDPWRG